MKSILCATVALAAALSAMPALADDSATLQNAGQKLQHALGKLHEAARLTEKVKTYCLDERLSLSDRLPFCNAMYTQYIKLRDHCPFNFEDAEVKILAHPGECEGAIQEYIDKASNQAGVVIPIEPAKQPLAAALPPVQPPKAETDAFDTLLKNLEKNEPARR